MNKFKCACNFEKTQVPPELNDRTDENIIAQPKINLSFKGTPESLK